MIFERPPKKRARVEIVPMIDITFTIITFFLVFTVFRTDSSALRLNLPKAISGEKNVQAPVVVTVSTDGEFSMDGGVVSQDGLQSYLKERLATSPQQTVIIKADREVKYQYLVDAMDAVRSSGGSQIALAVEREAR